MYGNIDSNSKYLQPPYDGQYSAFETSHDRSSYATLLALDENGTTSLTQKLADTATPDAGYYKGKFYSFFPPGLAYGALPFYKLGKVFNLSLFFAYFTIIIYAVLSLMVLYKISREVFYLPIWVSSFVVICTALASTYLNYVVTFYQHVPGVFFLLTMYYTAFRFKHSEKYGLVWASLSLACYGFSSFFDYPNLVLLSPILIYLIHSGLKFSSDNRSVKIGIKTSLLASSLVLITIGVTHMYYNYTNFGNFKRFSNSLPMYAPYLDREAGREKPNEDESSVEKKEQISFSLTETNLTRGTYSILFEVSKSLLTNFPLYFLFILGVWSQRKKMNIDKLILLSVMVVNFFLYASFNDPWGGWAFGPRYLVPSMPIAILFFSIWLSGENWVVPRKLVALAFFSYGAVCAFIGVVAINSTIPFAVYQPYMNNRPIHFLDDFRFLEIGKNGTFIYNTYLKDKVSLQEYYFILVGLAFALCIFCLFVLPFFERINIRSQENR